MLEFFNTIFAGPYGPWLPGAIYLILLATAAWDARTGIVPNIPLAIGAAAIIVGRFLVEEWPTALVYIAMGFGAWAVIWVFNEIWFRVFKKDAIGMGDAKWTALAVAAFGPVPALFAWLAGSWVAIAWIGLSWLMGHKIKKVYYAPFLLCGLTIGLLITHGVIKLPYPFSL